MDLDDGSHPQVVVVADEALELVHARREVQRQPRRLARLEPDRLGVLVVPAVSVPVVHAAKLELDPVAELAAVADHERDRPRPDRLRLRRESPLAERELEAAGTGIDAATASTSIRRRPGREAADDGGTREDEKKSTNLGHCPSPTGR